MVNGHLFLRQMDVFCVLQLAQLVCGSARVPRATP
jgi:hypothetical protein